MALKPDGIQSAADREKEFHPTRSGGSPITAWQRRAETLTALVEQSNALVLEVQRIGVEIDALKGALESRPF
jgi:hypothetical protein